MNGMVSDHVRRLVQLGFSQDAANRLCGHFLSIGELEPLLIRIRQLETEVRA